MPTPCDDMIARYQKWLRRHSYTEASIDTYGRLLRAADRQLQHHIDESNTEEIEDWLWREGISLSSRADYHKALNGFHTWAEQNGELDYNPMRAVARPKVPRRRPRVAQTSEVAWIVTEAPEPFRCWGRLAAYGGMRCIEISRAQRAHFTQETTTIELGKGNKPRMIATHPMLWEAVRDLPAGPLTDLDPRQISLAFIHFRDRHGLTASLHRMRGWFCTQGYRATRDLIACQHNMGHAKPDDTAGYIDLPDEERRAPIAALPVFCTVVDAVAPAIPDRAVPR